jgi:hypothetical protein
MVTAEKDIWNEALNRLSGCSASTTSAAQATERSDKPRRSSSTPMSATASIRKARCVGSVAPAINA